MTVHRLHLQRTSSLRPPLAPRHRRVGARPRARQLLSEERGDVPGWVMITLVTGA